MTHWNYRVIRFEPNSAYGEDDEHFAIHEVYYNDDDTPHSYGEFPASAIWDEDGEGGNILDMMREALKKPVLTLEDFK